jgi:hypothetical protein
MRINKNTFWRTLSCVLVWLLLTDLTNLSNDIRLAGSIGLSCGIFLVGGD